MRLLNFIFLCEIVLDSLQKCCCKLFMIRNGGPKDRILCDSKTLLETFAWKCETSQLHTMNWVLHNFLSLPYFFFFQRIAPTLKILATELFRVIFSDDISYFYKNYFKVFQIKRKLGTNFKRLYKRVSYE